MKKLTYILLLLASFVTSYSKQSYDVVTSGGYLLNDKIHFSEGVLDFKNSASMGLAFIARYDDSKEFELDYSFAPQTKVHFQSFKPFLYNEFDTKINIHQVHINLLSYLTKKTLIQPFYSSGVGVAIFDVLEGGD